MATSRPATQLRSKSSISSSTQKPEISTHVKPTPRSPVPNSREQTIRSSQSKTFTRTTSDISGKSKTQQKQQTSIATLRKPIEKSAENIAKRLPARKPVEKPQSISLPPQRKTTPPTINDRTLKTSTILQKQLKSITSKSAKHQLSLKSQNSKLLRKGIEASASRTTNKTEESQVVVAPQLEVSELPTNSEDIEPTVIEPSVKTDMHDDLVVEIPEQNVVDLAAENDALSIQELDTEATGMHDEVKSHEVEGKDSELENNNKDPVNSEALDVISTAESVEEPTVRTSDSDKLEVKAKDQAPLVAESRTEEKVLIEELNSIAAKAHKDTEDKGAETTMMLKASAGKSNVVQGKRTETPKSNAVIEETRSKLLEERKSKVRALVGAFETVMS